MFLVHSLPVAILFCVLTMLGWGSWANTQKLAGKEKWPFELFYWDYAIGVLLFGALFAATFGTMGSAGPAALDNLSTAQFQYILPALISGAIFNVSNILLVVGIGAAGMSVAFPIGVGLALVIGTLTTYLQEPKGQPVLLFGGVVAIVLAMVLSAMAHNKLPGSAGSNRAKGLICSILAGCIMGSFYPQLMHAISPDFNTGTIQPGMLTPYVALFFFGVGVFASNFLWNTIFMRAGHATYSQYFQGGTRLHLIGILGGIIWMIALCFNVVASGVAGPAISYALGQGATLVAALWGLLIWREFRNAPGTGLYLVLMLTCYTGGLILIGAASQ